MPRYVCYTIRILLLPESAMYMSPLLEIAIAAGPFIFAAVAGPPSPPKPDPVPTTVLITPTEFTYIARYAKIM